MMVRRSLGLLAAVVGLASCREKRPLKGADSQATAPSSGPAAEGTPPCDVIYVVTSKGDLEAFYPGRREFVRIGHVECFEQRLKERLGSGPRSIAVSAEGTAWMGSPLTGVDLRTATCTPIDGIIDPVGFADINLGLVRLEGEDVLFAADDHGWGGDVAPSLGLARIDRSPWKLVPVPLHPRTTFEPSFLIAGTEDGRFFIERPVGSLAEIDPKTWAVAEIQVGDYTKGQGVPLAYWKGALWFFSGAWPLFVVEHEPNVTLAHVARFDLHSRRLEVVLPEDPSMDPIAAAGAGMCPPNVGAPSPPRMAPPKGQPLNSTDPSAASTLRALAGLDADGVFWLPVKGDFPDADLLLYPDGRYITHIHNQPGSSGHWRLDGDTLTLDGWFGDRTLLVRALHVDSRELVGEVDGGHLIMRRHDPPRSTRPRNQ